MPEYRLTPEREAILRRLYDAHDATQSRTVHIPPNWREGLELKWSQQDEVIREFGSLITFDWTVTDLKTGATELVRGVSTQCEAEDRARQARGWTGLLSATRHLRGGNGDG